ncbi:MAG TPA: double zinc ribbon domain-containing protein [Allosphingosinicella sp.]|nr:double zinc ribbon domain-containing protein [Allosphingosinicella sp.]
MHAVTAVARHTLRHVIDFALPPRCPGCGVIVQEEHSFCLECWSGLVFLGEPCCARCGLPFEHDGGGAEAQCGACMADPPRFDAARAAVAYGDVPRKVALKLKYGGRPGVAETMARLMARHLPAGGGGALLAPVPLHRWRIWKRGYNQAALIAAALARRSGAPLALDLLERTKATPYLRGMGPRERAATVRAAFRVAARRREMLAGRDVILVDDVFTSGATAGACAAALKRAGAGSVTLVSWARVVRGGDY